MDWYRGDDVIVAKGQCAWSRFPSQDRLQHWGANKLGNGAADQGYLSCESMMIDGEMDRLLGEEGRAEISGVRGGVSESSIYWTALLDNQDYQLDGVPGTDQTGENFMNLLLVDDVCASEHFHFHGYSSDMMLDSPSGLYNLQDMGSYEHLNAEEFNIEEFPYSLDWEKKQSDTPHYNFLNMTSNGVPQYNTPLGNVTAHPQQAPASRRVGDQPSVEETVLQEFGSAMQKMADVSRLCFRDALYRLASNSEKHSTNQGLHVDNLASEEPFARTAERVACEARTNAIDRAIADLMFNKPYYGNSQQGHISRAKLRNGNPFKQQ